MYSAIAANKRKTVLIMLLFIGLIVLLGWLYTVIWGAGPNFLIGVLIGALIYTVISYFISARVALTINRAQKIEKRDNPRLWRTVENLAITEGMPMPAVYIMEDPALNAFATGRNPNHASICATTGLLDALTDSELEGVMAHELGHIKNYDIRVNMIAFAMVAVIGLLADILLRMTFFRDDEDTGSLGLILGIVAAILAPLAATLIQLAISRQREYLADATGAMTTRHPEGLASALEKIGSHTNSITRSHQNSSTAHMFFANPLSGKSVAHLFSTHPPVKDRIARLRKNATKA